MDASGIRTLRLPDPIRACLFDMDGVLTDTARVHAAAWKEMFDAYLSDRASRAGEAVSRPFDLEHDYDDYVDGKPRFEGARSFLASRGIDLPDGSPARPARRRRRCSGLANRKDELVLRMIRERGVEPYPGSVRFVHAVRDAGLRTAVVSSSAHCREVLEAAGIEDLFEVRVDGNGRRTGTAQRASPRRTPTSRPRAGSGSGHEHAAVFEDALAGVEAGRAGRFGYVVGVDRSDHARGAARARSRRGGARPGRAGCVAVIDHHAYPAEPWAVREQELDLDMLAQSESIFALCERAPGAPRQSRRRRAARRSAARTWAASTSRTR